jgi:hypothetical protein
MRWLGLHFRAAYPENWSDEQKANDIFDNGPSYNKARRTALVNQLAE